MKIYLVCWFTSGKMYKAFDSEEKANELKATLETYGINCVCLPLDVE